MPPELRQRVTHCGLAAVEPQGRPRDVLLLQQGVQGEQKIEIDATQIIHDTNILHDN